MVDCRDRLGGARRRRDLRVKHAVDGTVSVRRHDRHEDEDVGGHAHRRHVPSAGMFEMQKEV